MAKAKGIAVVTGGNRGIGREICRQWAEQGFHVILTARDAAKGREAAKALKQELGPKAGPVEFFRLDVTDAKRIRTLARPVERKHGGCGVLVNNAGIYLEGGYDTEGSPIDSIQNEPTSKVTPSLSTNIYGPL